MRTKRTMLAVMAAALIVVLTSCLPGGVTTTSHPTSPVNPTTSALPPSTTPPTTATSGTLNVYFLDVGQGDSEIVTVDGKAMLIDAGTNASTTTLINDIKSIGITRFDVVVGTHPHEDHIGGMDAVINQFGIGAIYMPKVSTTTKTFTDVLTAIKNKGLTVTTPVPGSTFTLGAAQCTILAPNSQTYSDLNSYSIVIKLVYGNTSFLFTGDAQTDSEQEMLAKGYSLKADVLKVGHHGSSTSTSAAFLQAVSPRLAVIEVGAGNTYGHPAQTTLTKLANIGANVYRTDLNGTVLISSDGTNLRVATQR
jgi:competence protein ComEC